MKLAGIDYGSKRVGVAATDESGAFAIPRVVLANDDRLLGELERLLREWGIGTVIVGESRNLDGTANAILQPTKSFVKELEKRGFKVVMHPEMYTSLEAERLQGKSDMLDASAASLILKSYIDTQDNQDRGIDSNRYHD